MYVVLLLQACLMENPKSYSSWHHRKWVVSHGLCSLEAELQLVARFVHKMFCLCLCLAFIFPIRGSTTMQPTACSDELGRASLLELKIWPRLPSEPPAAAAAVHVRAARLPVCKVANKHHLCGHPIRLGVQGVQGWVRAGVKV